MKRETTWKRAVGDVLQRLPPNFTLADVRPFHDELGAMFPQNMHVEAKVRQTLQLLRDRGELEFLGNGRYRRLGATAHFSCMLDLELGKGYSSGSQIARAVVEPWAALNLYCLECASEDVSALPNNHKVADLRCPDCETVYQVKSRHSRFGDKVVGGEYKTYATAAENGIFPNLFLIEWDPRFSAVFVVQAIHGGGVTAARILPRRALAETARRAGYQGCIIDVSALPRVDLVRPELREPPDCRSEWIAAKR